MINSTAHHVQEQVDGLSIFKVHSLRVLSQLKQSIGGHLWSNTTLRRSNNWSVFFFLFVFFFFRGGLDLDWGKGWQSLEKKLFSWNTVRLVGLRKPFTPCVLHVWLFSDSARIICVFFMWNYFLNQCSSTFLLAYDKKHCPLLISRHRHSSTEEEMSEYYSVSHRMKRQESET